MLNCKERDYVTHPLARRESPLIIHKTLRSVITLHGLGFFRPLNFFALGYHCRRDGQSLVGAGWLFCRDFLKKNSGVSDELIFSPIEKFSGFHRSYKFPNPGVSFRPSTFENKLCFKFFWCAMAARVAFSRSSLPLRQTIKQVARQRPHARFNSSQSAPPPKSGSWTLPLAGVVALAGAAGYYYYKRSGYADGMSSTGSFPVAPGKKQAETIAKPGDYQAVYNAIAEVLEDGADDYDDGSFGPVIVRLAWHASGTYDKETGTGGSNGATMVHPSPFSRIFLEMQF